MIDQTIKKGCDDLRHIELFTYRMVTLSWLNLHITYFYKMEEIKNGKV